VTARNPAVHLEELAFIAIHGLPPINSDPAV